ncbi:MAG: tetratricopeptide repeat protein [Brumimicrobium sp.]
MKIQIVLFIIFIVWKTGISQTNNPSVNPDSLRSLWNNPEAPDTIRLKAVNELIWAQYLYKKPDSAFILAQGQYDLAKSLGLKKHMGQALNTQGGSFYIRGEFNEAIHYYKKGLKIQKEIDNDSGVANSLGNIGLLYKEQGNYAKAIDYYMQSLSIEKKINDEKNIAASLNNIGVIYLEQNDYDKALKYYFESLEMQRKINHKRGIGYALNNIGNTYKEKGELDEAEKYYSEALETYDKIDEKTGVAHAYTNLSYIYLQNNDIELASEYLNKSYIIFKSIDDKKGIALSLVSFSEIAVKKENWSRALIYANKALKLSQETGTASQIKSSSRLLTEIYEKLNEPQKALDMHKLYIKTRDSIQSEKNKKEIIRKEFQFNYEQKVIADSIESAKDNKILEAKLRAQDEQISREKTQRFSLYGGIFLVLTFTGFIYNRFQKTKKQKLIIEEKEMETNKQNIEITNQKVLVEAKNEEITDSINYAKRLQNAILPSEKKVKDHLKDSFINYLPKDIVAGDFYYLDVLEEKGKKLVYVVAADCTGHGVPGAMVSILGSNGLKRCIQEFKLREPGKILDKLSELITESFTQSEERIRDGMDLAICCLEVSENNIEKVHYAGANNPLWVINPKRKTIPETAKPFKQGGGFEIKANKQAIGYTENMSSFDSHTFDTQEGDKLYMFTDGFSDQFGGKVITGKSEGKKYKSPNFRKFLLSIYDKNMNEQKNLVSKEFNEWKGTLEQVDDVCIIGIGV